VALGTAVAVLAACSSTTVIQSLPSGARLYLNGEVVGNTPYTLTDTRIVGSVTHVRLEMPGYDPFITVIVRNEEFDVGACIGGVLVLIPFLWIMGYKASHTYELRPAGSQYPPMQPQTRVQRRSPPGGTAGAPRARWARDLAAVRAPARR
jgi:hypothetical protein